ncbi:Lipopolysaccharide export system protein LptC [Halomicronema hongdechloris C2206]|uniref:Lipopolysaccharide export system protein LptC n=1 Tax=Halomicronema hongdechloris C2206 TaxID=1641165 RepID=A0A1Z3HFR8_9CYAN|nr:LPS export ABC transporter periplasmic protein LptC [Halomicronema hongdechloris]ASC69125.1 Lipopolysaccharide export system protein LptC [Halomicronema hongdechloris C2206]
MGKGRRLAIGLVGLGIALATASVWLVLTTRQDRQLRQNGTESEAIDSELFLQDVTLEQSDENGDILWRVKADEVNYGPDRKVAQVTNPDGELFQDGRVVYRVTAERGEIRENGKVIFLQENIVARGIDNKMVLRGQQLEWHPDKDEMILRDGITGDHPQVDATAQEARIYNQAQRIELIGNVVATSVVEDPQTQPWVKLQTEWLEWLWAEERLRTDRPLTVEQFEQEKVRDTVTGQEGEMDLARRIVTLRDDVNLQLLEFPLQARSDVMTWLVSEEEIRINQPLRLYQPEDKITITAQQGVMDLRRTVAVLQQQVEAVGQTRDARLKADRMTWDGTDQTIVATGNVFYQQGDPAVTLRGPRAVGRLDNETIVVNGGRVVTEITPN